jgi:hypothetical protein
MIAALPAKADTVIEWEKEKDGPKKDYSIDGLGITITDATNEKGESPRLQVTSRGGADATVYGAERSLDIPVKLRITKLDPAHSDTDVMFGVFTGGAHCCTAIKILSLIDGRWRVVDLGSWDGDEMPAPQDLSGNGKPALVFGDDAFLYAFASYAESATPLKILRVRNGETVDVSADPAYASLHRQNMIATRKLCAERSNGGCAAYVAGAARIGMFRQAWEFMRKNYNRQDGWDLNFCDVPDKGKYAQPVTFHSFPRALDWFLRKHGYLPTITTPPLASGARQAVMLCGRTVDYDRDLGGGFSAPVGIWTGNWSNPGRLCGGLIIKRVGGDGTADVIYVYGPATPGGRAPWRQQHQTALMGRDGNLTFQDDQASTFIFNGELGGDLSGKFIGRSGTLTGSFARLP